MIPLQIVIHEGIQVVRDDLLPGGSKVRVLPKLLFGADEFVYASPAYGYAQVALAHACRMMGKSAVVFTAERKQLHPRTQEAIAAGARVCLVPNGYLCNVQSKAKAYCEASGSSLLPFGLDTPDFLNGFAEIAATLPVPEEVWTVAGSGTLIRALQIAWPNAEFNAVQVGRLPNCGRAKHWIAPEKFEQPAKLPPPFPSCANYDAKAWRFIKRYAKEGALFWNVAA